METNPLSQHQKVAELHEDCTYWVSTFNFLEEELIFMKKLLESYVFEPNTPNLFERLQDYKSQLASANVAWASLKLAVKKHENELGGMLECKDNTCDLTFYEQHKLLKKQVLHSFETFKLLKSEIFNYAGGILKNRKP
ncbi:hypothetical protein [Cellulophaga sp. Hel_I_12]|uniref:hypothetical protein n=1 Tax=Cellulophaga sp. Hel_I_12 TaxID=1249972 RepID=UPI00064648F4|nr:hypothetical protein [Cellulophaga sp. Hel_I_12]